MKSLAFLLTILFSLSAFSAVVPKHYKDARSSEDFAEYYYAPEAAEEQGVSSVHAVVQDIARDGRCDSSFCFRTFIYINGGEKSGTHVATFVSSPGVRGHRTPVGKSFKLTRKAGYYQPRQPRGNKFGAWDAFRYYASKKYGSPMPEAMFFTGYGIALHGSYDAVDGNPRSHGCVRMFPNEARVLQSWVREARGKLRVTVRDTRSF